MHKYEVEFCEYAKKNIEVEADSVTSTDRQYIFTEDLDDVANIVAVFPIDAVHSIVKKPSGA